MASPPRLICPEVGAIIPEIARSVVVLPAPFEPISVMSFPAGTLSEMPWRTSTLP